jgi:uncharacterized protein YqjF (DUF2071 family)
MRQRVPPEMPLDTFDGQCWIGIVPFYMSHVRPRWVPPLAGLLCFPELNVRTYVTLDNKPGVYFFSLDTVYQSVVWAARTFYHLPYWQAQMQVDVSEDKVAYSSRRNLGAAQLSAFCRPATPLVACQPGSLEHWLTERYCFYTRHGGRIYRGEIHHGPWPLQNAEAEFGKNTMATAAGIALPGCAPLVGFSRRHQVLIWPLTQLP